MDGKWFFCNLWVCVTAVRTYRIVHYSISLVDDWEYGSQKYIAVIMINIFGAMHRSETLLLLSY